MQVVPAPPPEAYTVYRIPDDLFRRFRRHFPEVWKAGGVSGFQSLEGRIVFERTAPGPKTETQGIN